MILIFQLEQGEIDDVMDSEVIEEDVIDAVGDEEYLVEDAALSRLETSLDASSHNILQNVVDPVAWKTELERVGPKLKVSQQFGTNEWRSHVDQTLASKGQIEKVIVETQSELQSMFK